MCVDMYGLGVIWAAACWYLFFRIWSSLLRALGLAIGYICSSTDSQAVERVVGIRYHFGALLLSWI